MILTILLLIGLSIVFASCIVSANSKCIELKKEADSWRRDWHESDKRKKIIEEEVKVLKTHVGVLQGKLASIRYAVEENDEHSIH